MRDTRGPDWIHPCTSNEECNGLGDQHDCDYHEMCRNGAPPNPGRRNDGEAVERATANRAEEVRAADDEAVKREDEARDREARRNEDRRREVEQERFIRERDATPLKTGPVTSVTSIGQPAAPVTDHGIGGLRSSTSTPNDLRGVASAWKQLNCAASISKAAIGAIARTQVERPSFPPTQTTWIPQYNDFNFLADQAFTALTGGPMSVNCPSAPAFPDVYGMAGYDRTLAKQRFQALLDRTRLTARKVQELREQRWRAIDKLIKAEEQEFALGGRTDLALRADIDRLEKERDAMPPPAGPPSPGVPSPEPLRSGPGASASPTEPKSDLLEEAKAAARASRDALEKATSALAAPEAELAAVGAVSEEVARGAPGAIASLERDEPTSAPIVAPR